MYFCSQLCQTNGKKERKMQHCFSFSVLLRYPLSGLKVIAQKFPEGMTTGSIPSSCFASPTSSKRKKSSVPQQPSQAAEQRWRFTLDELAKIQEHLDEILIPSNPNSKTVLTESHQIIEAVTDSHAHAHLSCVHCRSHVQPHVEQQLAV